MSECRACGHDKTKSPFTKEHLGLGAIAVVGDEVRAEGLIIAIAGEGKSVKLQWKGLLCTCECWFSFENVRLIEASKGST